MKHVLICEAQAPFITGGAEILVEELRLHLERRGFEVAVARVPFKWYPVEDIPRQGLAWRLLDVTESNGIPIDLVIPTKFPSYLVRHPRKVAWLFHQHREAYDLFGTPYCSLRDTPEHHQVRAAIQSMDDAALSECRKVYTISRNVAGRLAHYNHLAGTPLYPPPKQVGRYRCDAYGDYLLYAGRIETLKRVDLLVEAVARAGRGVRLKIAGRGVLEGELRRRIERLGVGDRVDLLGFVSAEDLIALYANCRAALYAPVNEDYGYVTVEAFLSHKPVITTSDAGGPLEFVTDGETGVVTPPDAQALADGIDRLWKWSDNDLRAAGAAGHECVRDITWDHVIDRLTESLA
jgi:glycosyltransferase involved in cell wall biosynthesis